MAIMVAGGAGYIGSHTVRELLERGEEVVVFDNLSKGHRAAVGGAKIYIGDLRDEAALDKVFRENEIESVIDFAASIEVGESMKDPLGFYSNNVCSTVSLLKAMRKYGAKSIVFSSTAAVYGQPDELPITERCAKRPQNAYGETKLAVEQMLKWCDNAYGIKYTCLRYFNAAGAHVSGEIGEDHAPETHLIPIVLQAAAGKRDKLYVFGSDYDTPDGTCVRDYIHVSDLAKAHLLALDAMRSGGGSAIYNLGNGKGFSVLEIIETAREVTGKAVPYELAQRRAGDPASLVASSDKIRKELGWSPRFGLSDIIDTAWKWHSSHPSGYGNL
ncbi:MAG: UDP-glucose 4-epimerase GalE [Christensenellales bacterium]|jgi:UDP-glucose 4-epimerase